MTTPAASVDMMIANQLDNMIEPSPRLYYPIEEVLSSRSFYWIGRGGYSITHSGNVYVRSIISQHANQYNKMKRPGRIDLCSHLLQNQFRGMKFVIPREKLLSNLAQDDKKASGRGGARRIGLSRRQSLMDKHHSIEKIKSYPDNVCVEVGENWTRDILGHQFREDAREHVERNRRGSKSNSSRIAAVVPNRYATGDNQTDYGQNNGGPQITSGNKRSRSIGAMDYNRPSTQNPFGSLEFDIPNTDQLDQLTDILFRSDEIPEVSNDSSPRTKKRQRTMFMQQQQQQDLKTAVHQTATPQTAPNEVWGKELHEVEFADLALFMSSFTTSTDPVGEGLDFSWGSTSTTEDVDNAGKKEALPVVEAPAPCRFMGWAIE